MKAFSGAGMPDWLEEPSVALIAFPDVRPSSPLLNTQRRAFIRAH